MEKVILSVSKAATPWPPPSLAGQYLSSVFKDGWWESCCDLCISFSLLAEQRRIDLSDEELANLANNNLFSTKEKPNALWAAFPNQIRCSSTN